ncbi:phenoloxidase-activating factor 2-like [Onthophagus taurus]|uniref:phenoloxidase-activating factor 2-like n=1 Tax=Onthophagus taurus TaxID=166361 RepID=UPI0039BE3421
MYLSNMFSQFFYVILFFVVFLRTTTITASPVSDESEDSLKTSLFCDENEKKVCVPYYMCNPTSNTIIPSSAYYNYDMAEPVNHFINLKNEGNKCPNILDKCCKQEELPPNTEAAPISSTFLNSHKVNSSQLSYCGIRNPHGLGFTITGDDGGEAQYGEFPWVLAILKTDYNPAVDESSSICGGSLISPQVVLTAAHCVENYLGKLDKIKVRAGEWDTSTDAELYPKQERGVSKIITHINYNTDTLENDLALIFLDKPYTRAANVGTICLPLYKQVANSMNCFTGGWGKTDFDNNASYANILKKIELPIVPHDVCQAVLRKNGLGPNYILPDTLICAGEYGKDACKGDGGSPLICPDPNNPKRYVQVGIVVGGIECFKAPGLYADVAGARHWIDAIMAQEGYNTIPYSK